jgi:hypothetical protein
MLSCLVAREATRNQTGKYDRPLVFSYPHYARSARFTIAMVLRSKLAELTETAAEGTSSNSPSTECLAVV